jgi:ABC-type antimicrobial peptide transport system ATPase subunit
MVTLTIFQHQIQKNYKTVSLSPSFLITQIADLPLKFSHSITKTLRKHLIKQIVRIHCNQGVLGAEAKLKIKLSSKLGL